MTELSPHAPPSAPKSRAVPWLIAAVAVLVVAVLGLAVALFGWPFGGSALSKDGAERACRTAFGAEWERRVRMTSVDSSILPSLQGIDMQEVWETADGYSTNATVRYTLTTGVVDPVQGTVDLTCTVTGSDESPTTTVDNRN